MCFYRRNYPDSSPLIIHTRKSIWLKNIDIINKHNIKADMGYHSYRLGMNKFGDMVRISSDLINVIYCIKILKKYFLSIIAHCFAYLTYLRFIQHAIYLFCWVEKLHVFQSVNKFILFPIFYSLVPFSSASI